jgi:ABC-type branched-subunit amino acid transport system ATPase component
MRVLGIAMAIQTGATMLLLDEPAAGLSARSCRPAAHHPRRPCRGRLGLGDRAQPHFLMGLVSRAVVLDAGAVIADARRPR